MMRRSGKNSAPPLELLQGLDTARPVAGLAGPGRWLVTRYAVVGLFSLKSSLATSSVGKTLVTPTPYSIKMAAVAAGFRAGLADDECARLVEALARCPVRVQPSEAAVVTHTFVKVRQEPKARTPGTPYISSIAYREVAYCEGDWLWAFDLAGLTAREAELLVCCLPHVNYVGKRASFIQFLDVQRLPDLDESFTQEIGSGPGLLLPARSHVTPLDDFGPEATLDVLSSFSDTTPKAGKHRHFPPTLIPLGMVNSGPGFSHYER
jgi:hypothetical protein